jgi:hypothetical protein
VEIEKTRSAIESKKIKISDHADEEAVDDQLALTEILQSVQAGEIIEDYPTDKPYPSCLVLGKNENGSPIHSVWAYNNVMVG